MERLSELFQLIGEPESLYTTVARWIFIAIAAFVFIKSIGSLLRTTKNYEVWAYFNVDEDNNVPITHWENLIGRSRRSDLTVDNPTVSRNHGTLIRGQNGKWKYMDLGSRNGSTLNDKKITPGRSYAVEVGDTIGIGSSQCTVFPISLEEHTNNEQMRVKETFISSPWSSLVAITIFQIMTMIQLHISLADDYLNQISLSFISLCIIMWVYVITMRALGRRGFEIETIAFFLSTLSLAIASSKYHHGVFKQFAAIVIGIVLFVFMCTFLRDINRTKAVRKYMYLGAAVLLILNLILGTTRFGANNWIMIGSLSFQPSEIVKLAFIWGSAASLDELLKRKNSILFMMFSGFCFCCLALMGDFGTALIFFVSFIVITFLRSGDVTKIILILGAAFVGGLMIIRFKSYVANRFDTWGKVWEFADDLGYQQTRTMSAASSGGLLGVGAGNGWLKNVAASETDLVFGFISEEWGIIIAVLSVLSIITLSIFAVKSIMAGRSTYYTIAACSAMSLFIFQTILNVFGSIDLLPLTGVTFPFVSLGGTSMITSWGMLAFLKSVDTRISASLAVSDFEEEG